jgi:hypothetical protein
MPQNAFSSLGKSVIAYQPYYAPPVAPQTEFVQGGASHLADIRSYEMWDQHSVFVSRAPRQLGMRWLYARVPAFLDWFRMIATGTVESTRFQPKQIHEFSNVGQNDAIYQAGYPRNMGWSEKVPTIPPLALGVSPNQMVPRPQIKRSIYVNRRPFTSGIPGVPATPTNGMRS